MMDLTITLPRPQGFDRFGQQELMTALRKASPALSLTLINKIRARTPRRTGALREDETIQPYTGAVSGARVVNLIRAYIDDAAQLSEWGRVYAQYQEYLPLGASTYTPQKAQMFYRVQSEDIGDIQAWAEETLQGAVDEFTATVEQEAV